MRILVVSDLHWASAGEAARAGHESRAIGNPVLRTLARIHRRFVWLAEPHAHNHRLEAILSAQPTADRVVANGDFTVDSAFVGVSDDAALASAAAALDRLRTAYPGRVDATLGDHDLGKQSLFGAVGGPRRASLERCRGALGLPDAWRRDLGRWSLIGVASTLLAWPVFAAEAPASERAWWDAQREAHLARVRELLDGLDPGQRLVLFVHDPTALPFLARLPWFAARMDQVRLTVIGHLHTDAVLGLARRLAGLPTVGFLGVTARRYSTALRRAREWEPFRVVLCPSPPGIQLLRDGGFLTLEIDPDGREPLRWMRHSLPWDRV